MEYSVRRCQEQARCLSDGRTGRLSPSSRMLSTPDPSRFRAMTTPWPRESGLRPENRPVGRPAYDPNMPSRQADSHRLGKCLGVSRIFPHRHVSRACYAGEIYRVGLTVYA